MVVMQCLTFNYNTVFIIIFIHIYRTTKYATFQESFVCLICFPPKVTWVIFRRGFPRKQNHFTYHYTTIHKRPAKQLLLLYCTEMMNHSSHLSCYQAFIMLLSKY